MNIEMSMKIIKNVAKIIFLMFLLQSSGCKEEKSTLFQLISAENSGIDFNNEIIENDTFNILEVEYIYNGGGVGIGDFNNDGFSDIYFPGNAVDNKLYLNKGNLKFEDITDLAGVSGTDRWCSGVALVDINNDGLLDIYVSATLKQDSLNRANLLYINKGVNSDGIPTFSESAARYGINDMGHTIQSAFLDYDRDGDLDLYLLVNSMNKKDRPHAFKERIVDGSSYNNDRIYQNNGDNTFSDVTEATGILTEGYGLGIAVADINNDGWPDIYVSNDYFTNDLLWINDQNGGFTNEINKYFKHQSLSAMGNDVADINNDALVDIIAVDMLPEEAKRKKMMVGANNYSIYINSSKYGYDYQYPRNTLQINQGYNAVGNPVFSETGQLSGVYQTDWSWAPLIADFDNDSYRDILITNGFPRDVTDNDFAAYASGIGGAVSSISTLLDSIPEIKIANYAFRNNGDLTFEDKTEAWGLKIPSYSTGAAYADLDNDGDLDYVVNNINDKAFLYENQLYNGKKDTEKSNRYLRVKLEGDKQKSSVSGAKILIEYGEGKKQLYEHSTTRGYLSSVENIAHFGLEKYDTIDSIYIFWPDGRSQLLTNIAANQILIVKQSDANLYTPSILKKEIHLINEKNLFQELSGLLNPAFKHEETDEVDFNTQVTLPHKFSQRGPGLGVGDVNGDGLDDFFVGGAANRKGAFFVQNGNGTFTQSSYPIVGEEYSAAEDMGLLFFDADNDDDLDLYVVSGSYEFKPGALEHQDRLYRNTGNGVFEFDSDALPKFSSNGSAVKAADFDKDGDLDLFVGGNVIPGQYPYADKSYLLKNEGGKFENVTKSIAKELGNIGITNDALWTDFDNDGNIDLIVAGEWMPVTFFQNKDGKLQNITAQTGLMEYTGWWNSLTAGDFDKDGDTDYVVGNLGLNTRYKGTNEYPLTVYAKDFDNNGNIDPILTSYLKSEDGTFKSYPMHAKDDLTFLIPRMKKKFPKHKSYAHATIHDVLTPEDKEEALILNATYMTSAYLENLGNGKFNIKSLPTAAQFAPVFGMLTEDFEGDGNLDVLLIGNSFSTEVSTGHYDALNGLLLKGNGKGDFNAIGIESGFFVGGDAKAMASLQNANGQHLVLVTQNQDSLKAFVVGDQQSTKAETVIRLEPMDAWAQIELKNGKKYKQEYYYGSTYMSQSARLMWLPDNVEKVQIFNFKGDKRTVAFNEYVNIPSGSGDVDSVRQ